MLPNLDVLQKKCADLGLTVIQQGSRPSKDDCVRVLKAHYLQRDFPNGLPYEEIEPMLCFAAWDLKESEQVAIWNSSAWAVQDKLNGCRMVLHFVKGVGVFGHGRNESVETFRYEEYSERFVFKTTYVPDFDATVDLEAIIDKPVNTAGYTTGNKGGMTKSSLHSVSAVMGLEAQAAKRLQIDQDATMMFHTFDVLKINGVDLRRNSLRARLVSLKAFEDKIKTTEIGQYFRFPTLVTENKKEYFRQRVKDGGEGIVAKNLNSTYEGGKRSRSHWVKAKKRIEYDAFVIGFEPGDEKAGYADLVGNFKFGINLVEGGVHWIGSPSNMTLEFRRQITETKDGKPVLKQEYYGRVAEISGQDISSRSYRLSHCTLDRWREGADGKSADQCVTSMKDLKERAAWVS